MRVQTVIAAQLATLAADATLVSLLGGAYVYARHSVELVEPIPGVYWSMPSAAPYEEVVEPAEVQWDIYGHSFAQVIAIEERLRQLLHYVTTADFGGVTAWSQFMGSGDFSSEKRVGIYRRIMDTRIEAIRISAA